MSSESKLITYLSLFLFFSGVAFAGLYIYCPENASEEYKYTLRVLYYFAIPLVLLGIGLSSWFRRAIKALKERATGWFWVGLAGLGLICVPVYSTASSRLNWIWNFGFSLCWLIGALLLAISIFLLAARINNWLSGFLCLVGSFLLAFFIGETYFLFHPSFGVGRYSDRQNSRYVKADLAQAAVPITSTPDGTYYIQPAHPSHAWAERDMMLETPLYDVRHTLDSNARRITPKAAARPDADILLFGCSFTFGFGLEDEETWAWKLATLLGPQWRIDNYGYSGFGAQQMLNMLEKGLPDPPTAPFRHAFFLAIDHHIRRFTGLFPLESSRYVKENGQIVRKGLTKDSPYKYLDSHEHFFNGSQLAKRVVEILQSVVTERNKDEFAEIYIWLIKQSARILEERYKTPLTVLLWPNAEWLKKDLDAAGIDTLDLRPMLAEWEKSGGVAYHIVPHKEMHPNILATSEIASGLEQWLLRLPGAPAAPDIQYPVHNNSGG